MKKTAKNNSNTFLKHFPQVFGIDPILACLTLFLLAVAGAINLQALIEQIDELAGDDH